MMDESKEGYWKENPYLLLNVIKRVWGVNGKADEDDVGVWVTQGPKTIVIFLSGSIP